MNTLVRDLVYAHISVCSCIIIIVIIT